MIHNNTDVSTLSPSRKKGIFSTRIVPLRQLSLLILVMLIMTYHSAWSAQLQLLNIQQGAGKLNQLAILDARPQSEWQQGHLPGAHSLSWEDYTSTDSSGVKYRILPPQQLAKRLGDMGISNDSDILIYGDADSSWGGEGWLAWTLAWLGHQGKIYLLDGGIAAWTAAKLPVNTLTATASPTEYILNLKPQVAISASALAKNPSKYTIVDTRNYWTEWLPGHIPTAIHIDWKNFYQGDQRQILPAQQFKQLLQENGVNLEKPVVYYCTGGIRSGFAWMVHTLAGLPAAINFEGGIEEWNLYQANK